MLTNTKGLPILTLVGNSRKQRTALGEQHKSSHTEVAVDGAYKGGTAQARTVH